MTPFPIILVCGNAGSGKDTVADKIVSFIPNSIKLAQADEMKRFAAKVFKFNDQQLWGPSQFREEADERYDLPRHWEAATKRFYELSPEWLFTLGLDTGTANAELTKWFKDLPREELTPRHVLQTLGTEFGRAVKYDLWTTKATNDAQSLLNGGYAYSRERGLEKATGKMAYDLVVISDGRFRNEVLNVKKLGGGAIKVVPPSPTSNAGKHQSESELDNIPYSWFDIVLENNKEHGLAGLAQAMLPVLNNLCPGTLYLKTFHPSTMHVIDPNTKAILDI